MPAVGAKEGLDPSCADLTFKSARNMIAKYLLDSLNSRNHPFKFLRRHKRWTKDFQLCNSLMKASLFFFFFFSFSFFGEFRMTETLLR